MKQKLLIILPVLITFFSLTASAKDTLTCEDRSVYVCCESTWWGTEPLWVLKKDYELAGNVCSRAHEKARINYTCGLQNKVFGTQGQLPKDCRK